MALTRHENGVPALSGNLTDNTDRLALWCGAQWSGFGCTLPPHDTPFPHMAGTSEIVVAIWHEGEQEVG
jgi:hypothetical protein